MDSEPYKTISKEEYKKLLKLHFNVSPHKIDDYLVTDDGKELNPKWFPEEDWESKEDVDLLELLEDIRIFEGDLLVLTDSCLIRNLGPVLIDSEHLREFVKNHLKNFGVCFFNTNVIIINLELKLIWIFHHEGIYALVDYNLI